MGANIELAIKPLVARPARIRPLRNFIDIKGRPPLNNTAFGRHVHPTERIYRAVCSDIDIDGFQIDQLVEVTNPYLQMTFDLMRAEKAAKCGAAAARSRLLYHGTYRANLNAIFSDNFNWRWFDFRSGAGVTFSSSIEYASQFGDRASCRVMVIAEVFVNEHCDGHLPGGGCNASDHSREWDVVVKLDDCEFLPKYQLFYHIQSFENSTNKDSIGTVLSK